MKIKIILDNKEVEAELNDSETAKAIYNTLPIEATFDTWGDEIYFSIPIKMKEENPVDTVELGTLAYWPPGNAFCIFYGKTPNSNGGIKPASPVNIIGKVKSIEIFKNFKTNKIRVIK